MRKEGFRVHPGWAAALVCAASLAGCKKEQPAPAAPVVASSPPDAGQVTAAAKPAPAAPDAAVGEDTKTPFVFKDVKLTRNAERVELTYTLVNQGRRRARGNSCLWLYDKDGVFLQNVSMGPVSLRGGESDVFEESESVEPHYWEQARSVQLFAADSCYADPERALSAVSHLDLAGRPVPAGTPAPRKAADPAEGTVLFDVKDVRLSQPDPAGSVSVTYTVTNHGPERAAASLCFRLYDDTDCHCSHDEASASNFSLAPGATATLTSDLTLDDEKHWDSTAHLKAYVTTYGCSSGLRSALSNVVEFDKPEDIHSPREDSEPEHDDSDHEDPDPEPMASPGEEDSEATGGETDGQ